MQEFIQKIAREAGDAIFELFGKTSVLYTKENSADVVTEADLLSNKILTGRIKEKYPDHAIQSEEGDTKIVDVENLWVIDPLDGSRNFSTQTPLFGVIIAFVKHGVVELAAIYLPCTKELFFAEKGKGAFLNDQRIHCSETENWEYSYGCAPVSMKATNADKTERFIKFARQVPYWMSALGSIAVAAAYVAAGRRDWYASGGGSAWDYTGPSLLLVEAGCKVSDIEGNEWRYGCKGLVATNPFLFPQLLKLVKGD